MVDKFGNDTPVTFERNDEGTSSTIAVMPRYAFKPGRYTLRVLDEQGNSTEEEFSWGVLAMNTNKSVYLPGETAKIALAVLDEKGEMVCDASVSLDITDPEGNVSTRSTDDGTITVTNQCFKKTVSLIPDYETTYQVGGAGKYSVLIRATTKNGTEQLSDSFEVRMSVPFDVERIAATRIYPVKKYPVRITVAANVDFTGTVVEVVPASYEISPLEGTRSYDSVSAASSSVPQGNIIGTRPTQLSYPFSGDYPMTLGYGNDLEDPLLIDWYRRFGLVGHDGVDFGLPQGTPVLASADGTVILAGDGAYGTTVVLQHPWGRSYYGHLSIVKVGFGQSVRKGEVLGLSGSTGLSTGPHLHFGIKLNENDADNGYYGKVDPLPYLSNQTPLTPGDTLTTITWNISLVQGETIELGYQFDAPDISPQFYLAGPLTFRTSDTTSAASVDGSNPFVLGVETDPTLMTEDATATDSAVPQMLDLESPSATPEATPDATPAPTVDVQTVAESQSEPYASGDIVFAEARQWQMAVDFPTSQVTATSDTTTTSTSYTALDSMTITPGAGDYLVWFSSSIGQSGDATGAIARVSLYVGGVQVTHTEREAESEGSMAESGESTSFPVMIAAEVLDVGASDAIEVRWLTTSATAVAHERTLVVDEITDADVTQVSATGNTTTTNTSYPSTEMDTMTITPGAGDYLVWFSTSIANSTTSDHQFISIFSGGSQVTHTEREMYTEGSIANTSFPMQTHARITGVGASDEIEVRWFTEGGTATAFERTLVIRKVEAADTAQASATGDDTTTSATDELMDSMTLTPGAGDFIIWFSGSIEVSSGNTDQFSSIYVGGSQVAHSERQSFSDGSIVNGGGLSSSFTHFAHAYVTDVGASDDIEVFWRTTGGTATVHERTLVVENVTPPDVRQMHYRWRNDIAGESSLDTGDGTDGAFAPAGTFNIHSDESGGRTYPDGIAYRVVAPSDGASSVTGNAAADDFQGIAVGDEVLLINMQGTSADNADVGSYEFLDVQAVNSTTLTFESAITKSYDGTTAANQMVVVQRVPNYTTVTLDSTDSLTATAWDGLSACSGGAGASCRLTGIIVFRATGAVSAATGTSITVDALGFRGGTGGTSGGSPTGGTNGESYDGTNGSGGTHTGAGTLGGGSGGNNSGASNTTGTRGGGGGGGAEAGGDATNAAGGGAGGAYGGGGGGGGGTGDGGEASGAGGSGGDTSVAAGGGGGSANNGTGGAGGNAGSAGSDSAGTAPVGTGGSAGSSTTTGEGGGASTADGDGGGAGGGGGGLYGDSALSDMFLGSGGGGGGGSNEAATNGQDGGRGGGIIFVAADSVTVTSTGTITADGAAGVTSGSDADPYGGSGGGAGGSVMIEATTVTLGTNLVTATGGSGGGLGATPSQGGGGGGGGVGRIRVERGTGSVDTNPEASVSGLSSVASWYADEDIRPIVSKWLNKRIRIEISNEAGSSTGPFDYRLEVSGPEPTSCTAASYTRVDSDDNWDVVASSVFTDGDPTSNLDPGLTDENTTFVTGQKEETSDQLGSTITLTNTQFTEIEYNLQASSTAVEGATYCFRVTDASDASLFTYTTYGQVYLGPSREQLMRHGKWFLNSNEQPFTF